MSALETPGSLCADTLSTRYINTAHVLFTTHQDNPVAFTQEFTNFWGRSLESIKDIETMIKGL